MAENSGISWTDHTMNFWWGCAKVSTECLYCYIYGLMKLAGKEPFKGPMRTKNWSKPDRWQRLAEKLGRRFRIFTCSMSDYFHPGADAWRPEAWEIIRRCTNLDWLILTKRPELIADRLPSDWGAGYSNVWMGTTCGVRSSLRRVAILKTIPAAIRFISAEPLLEAIDFTPHLDGSIDWIITGCEQAGIGKRRPMEMDWVRDIDRQCKAEGKKIIFDSLLDGVVQREWPLVAIA